MLTNWLKTRLTENVRKHSQIIKTHQTVSSYHPKNKGCDSSKKFSNWLNINIDNPTLPLAENNIHIY